MEPTEKLLLADGAIGEFLFGLGYPPGYSACEAVIRSPEIVASIHRDYASAGARVLTSNTFDANCFRLDARNLAHRCREINSKAVELASRNSDCLIMGSVGPPYSGRSFNREPLEDRWISENYLPQIEGLLEGGADIILLETQVDPDAALKLYRLVRRVDSGIPIAVSFTFGHDLLTPSGFSVEDSAAAFSDLAPVFLGANHGTGPLQFLDIHRRLKLSSSFRQILQPNSGTGRYIDGSFVFPRNPDHFCNCMISCADDSAAVLGGCCGTTPEFVSAMSARLEDRRRITVVMPPARERLRSEPGRGSPFVPPSLAAGLAKRDALVVEVLPPRGGDCTRLLRRAEKLSKLCPLTVSIADSPMGRVRMSPCIAGLYLRERLGTDVLVHFALRDRSLTRIQSDLLALAGAGLSGIFIISGDPPSLGDYPEATAVYDLTTDQSLQLLQNLSLGLDLSGKRTGPPAEFYAGTALSLEDQDCREKAERRWRAGSRFFITQPVYSLETLKRAEPLFARYPVLPALMPLKSRYAAEYLASEVPGIEIPGEMMDRIRRLDDSDVLRYSLERLEELMEEARGLVSGIYLSGSISGVMELGRKWRD